MTVAKAFVYCTVVNIGFFSVYNRILCNNHIVFYSIILFSKIVLKFSYLKIPCGVLFKEYNFKGVVIEWIEQTKANNK